MRRSSPDTPPYLSFCLIVRNCAQTLERTLKSIRERAPDCEISIVDTCSIDDSGMDFYVPREEWPKDILDREVETRFADLGKLLFVDDKWDPEVRVRIKTEPNPRSAATRADAAKLFAIGMEVKTVRCEYGSSTIEIAQRYADVFEVYRGPRGDWNEEMAWFDDAAAARNRSFENARGHWLAWCDSDDELIGPDEAERLLRLNGRYKPSTPGSKIDESTEVKSLEDILRSLERDYPHHEVVWCPYLYRQDKDGHATEWQDRERFVRNPQNYTWKEQAHEVLVAKTPGRAQQRPLYLAHLLFVHRKRFTAEDASYALARHFDVLLRQYEAGRRTHRVCVYLENYSRFLCPSRRGEFVRELYDSSSLPTDRYRALLKVAEFYADSGLFIEAMESIQSALHHKPELPDAYLLAGQLYARVDDAANAGRWMAKGVRCHAGLLEAETNPFAHLVKARAAAAMNLREGAWLALGGLHLEEAEALLQEASELMNDKAAYFDSLTEQEKDSATYLINFVENDRRAMHHARAIHSLWDYLVRNDETEKALKLLDSVPHNLRFHPLITAIDSWGDKLRRHLTDQQAYVEFYNDDAATGFKTAEQLGDKVHESLYERSEIVLAQLPKDKPIHVLEIGCADGIFAIPLLRKVPNIVEYVGVDANKRALAELERLAKQYGLEDRVRTIAAFDLVLSPAAPPFHFDVVLFMEVIEHVQDPVASVANLIQCLRPGGRLFISTPWGSYDKGNPREFDKRDPRGHLRAYMPRDLVEDIERAGATVEWLDGWGGSFGAGSTLVARVDPKPLALTSEQRPVAFVVPGALWDWNASTVLESGMGASEETIVFMARELAKTRRRVEVYGPMPRGVKFLPNEQVHDRVAYWTRQQLRHIPKNALVVISRGPYYGSRLDKAIGRPIEKALWLQDAFYDDLNQETAAAYRSIIVLSEWHRDAIAKISALDPASLTVIPNFVVPEQFQQKVDRRPHHFVWTSSPDRGLNILLAMWPRIRERWPDATLDIFYGWRGCMKLSSIGAPSWIETYRKVRKVYEQLRWQPGVTEHDMVSHEQIAREMLSASVWLYPTDFAEAGCVSSAKARAAGCIPVTRHLAALAETADCRWTQWVEPRADFRSTEMPSGEAFEDYTKTNLDAIETAFAIPERERRLMAEEAIEQYNISRIAGLWRRIIDGDR